MATATSRPTAVRERGDGGVLCWASVGTVIPAVGGMWWERKETDRDTERQRELRNKQRGNNRQREGPNQRLTQ